MIEYQQKSLFFKNMSSKNTDRELHYILIYTTGKKNLLINSDNSVINRGKLEKNELLKCSKVVLIEHLSKFLTYAASM